MYKNPTIDHYVYLTKRELVQLVDTGQFKATSYYEALCTKCPWYLTQSPSALDAHLTSQKHVGKHVEIPTLDELDFILLRYDLDHPKET